MWVILVWAHPQLEEEDVVDEVGQRECTVDLDMQWCVLHNVRPSSLVCFWISAHPWGLTIAAQPLVLGVAVDVLTHFASLERLLSPTAPLLPPSHDCQERLAGIAVGQAFRNAARSFAQLQCLW